MSGKQRTAQAAVLIWLPIRLLRSRTIARTRLCNLILYLPFSGPCNYHPEEQLLKSLSNMLANQGSDVTHKNSISETPICLMPGTKVICGHLAPFRKIFLLLENLSLTHWQTRQQHNDFRLKIISHSATIIVTRAQDSLCLSPKCRSDAEASMILVLYGTAAPSTLQVINLLKLFI